MQSTDVCCAWLVDLVGRLCRPSPTGARRRSRTAVRLSRVPSQQPQVQRMSPRPRSPAEGLKYAWTLPLIRRSPNNCYMPDEPRTWTRRTF